MKFVIRQGKRVFLVDCNKCKGDAPHKILSKTDAGKFVKLGIECHVGHRSTITMERILWEDVITTDEKE